MGVRKRILGLTFTIIMIVVIMMALVRPFQTFYESPEGIYMTEACHDIIGHETLRAQSDVDSVISIIGHHVLLTELEDSVRQVILNELDQIRLEVMFHDTNEPYYRAEFSRILSQMCYIHLSNAREYLMQNRVKMARESFSEAEHYLHDSLVFSEGNAYDVQYALLRKFKQYNKYQIQVTDVEAFTSELLRII